MTQQFDFYKRITPNAILRGQVYQDIDAAYFLEQIDNTGDDLDESGPIIEDITELCDWCNKFTEAIVAKPAEPDGRLGDHMCMEYKSSSAQDQCLHTCRLCELRVERRRQDKFSPDLMRIPKGFERTYISAHDDYGRNPSRITGIGNSCCHYTIWADQGSPASVTLSELPPILGPHSDHVCDLVQRWRHDCNSHKRCIANDDCPLPSRVLVLSGTGRRPSVQLMDSGGRRGQYLALSHCWGAHDKIPLRTTMETYEQHQKGLKFSDLPKTFRDVVELAQGIHIRYVWIDSLCIIQNNSQDWHAEAAKMGEVYSNASLVVAASGANDSSEGLFISERPRLRVLRLPYRMAGEIKGTFNMAIMPSDYRSIMNPIPLERRAWTLQEGVLARRIVSFMPGDISWICNTTRKHEYKTPRIIYGRLDTWHQMLKGYTKRSLTFASDRVEAMRGIATLYPGPSSQERKVEKSESSGTQPQNEYSPEYGVWKHGLAFQLLWYRYGPCANDRTLPHMPSWSWAATGTAKSWPSIELDPKWNKGAEELPERIVLTPAGRLDVLGHLSAVQPTSIARYSGTKLSDDHPRLRDMAIDCGVYNDDPHEHCLTHDIDESQGQTMLGLAIFDDDTMTEYTHAWFMIKRPKSHEPIEYLDFFCFESGFSDFSDAHRRTHKDKAYMTLLLARVSNRAYRRVGLAVLTHEAYDAFQVELQEFAVI